MASVFGAKLVMAMLLLILLTFSAVPRASASLYRGMMDKGGEEEVMGYGDEVGDGFPMVVVSVDIQT